MMFLSKRGTHSYVRINIGVHIPFPDNLSVMSLFGDTYETCAKLIEQISMPHSFQGLQVTISHFVAMQLFDQWPFGADQFANALSTIFPEIVFLRLIIKNTHLQENHSKCLAETLNSLLSLKLLQIYTQPNDYELDDPQKLKWWVRAIKPSITVSIYRVYIRAPVFLRQGNFTIGSYLKNRMQETDPREYSVTHFRKSMFNQLHKIKEWQAECFYVNRFEYKKKEMPNLIESIKNIKWSKLKRVSIVQCEIETVEGICRIEMDQLKELSLQKNKIISLTSLKKRAIPEIFITQNILQDNYQPQETHFLLKYLKHLDLQRMGTHPTQFQSLNFLAKVHLSQKFELRIASASRILSQTFLNTLKKKIPTLKYYCKTQIVMH